LPVLLRMSGLPHPPAPQVGWLLRVLLLRHGAVSSHPAAQSLLR